MHSGSYHCGHTAEGSTHWAVLLSRQETGSKTHNGVLAENVVKFIYKKTGLIRDARLAMQLFHFMGQSHEITRPDLSET